MGWGVGLEAVREEPRDYNTCMEYGTKYVIVYTLFKEERFDTYSY